MKAAIIGSRNFKNEELVRSVMDREVRYRIIGDRKDNYAVTGGAPGVDTIARQWMDENGFDNYKIIRPIDPAKKIDYLFRNIEIIAQVDFLYAFWDGESKGTKFTIEYAKKRGIWTYVYNEDGECIETKGI